MAKIAVITGASSGISKETTLALLNNGYKVYGISRTITDIEHSEFVWIEADFHETASFSKIGISIFEDHIDALINNAGSAAMNHAILTPASVMESLVRTNYLGTFLCCREAARLMQKTGGRIVNFTTVAVALSLEGEAAYAASKGAVETLTRVLAREFAAYGITVNAVGPTPVATDLIAKVPAEKIQRIVERQAIHRIGTCEDVINVMDFFLSPASSFVTGQVLYLGGV